MVDQSMKLKSKNTGNIDSQFFRMTSSFQFPFSVENASSMIVQHGDQFELRINNQVFSHLYNQGIALILTLS